MGALIGSLVVLVVVGVFVASFFVRRHGEVEHPDPSWRPSDEVFQDPTTRRTMRVWIDPAGERHYVPERYRRNRPN